MSRSQQDEVINLIATGRREIALKKFPGLTRGTCAAVLAHVTRGTYAK